MNPMTIQMIEHFHQTRERPNHERIALSTQPMPAIKPALRAVNPKIVRHKIGHVALFECRFTFTFAPCRSARPCGVASEWFSELALLGRARFARFRGGRAFGISLDDIPASRLRDACFSFDLLPGHRAGSKGYYPHFKVSPLLRPACWNLRDSHLPPYYITSHANSSPSNYT